MPFRNDRRPPPEYISPGRPQAFAQVERLGGPPTPVPDLPEQEKDDLAGIKFSTSRRGTNHPTNLGPANEHACVKCGQRAAHWHHWLEQQHLRSYARARSRDRATRRRTFRRLIFDTRNISPVCASCHGVLGLDHGQAFTFADVPPAAFAFALELGQESFERLRSTYH